MSKNKTPFKPDDVITWQRICEELIMPQFEAINTRLTNIEQAQKKEAVRVVNDKKREK